MLSLQDEALQSHVESRSFAARRMTKTGGRLTGDMLWRPTCKRAGVDKCDGDVSGCRESIEGDLGAGGRLKVSGVSLAGLT